MAVEALNEFGIVYLLPKTVGNYHRELRLKIEKEFKLTGRTELNAPSHITLKYRFQAEDIQEVEEILQDFSTTQTKTRWSLNGFNYFTNSGSFVIFIDVIPSQETRKAHAQFLDRLRQIGWMQWGPFDHAAIHYHVTLAHHGMTTENFDEVWAFVNQHKSPDIELFFDNLALLKIDDGIHTVYKTYRFLDAEVGLQNAC